MANNLIKKSLEHSINLIESLDFCEIKNELDKAITAYGVEDEKRWKIMEMFHTLYHNHTKNLRESKNWLEAVKEELTKNEQK